MAVAFVQGKAADAGPALSLGVTFTSNVTAGNLIVVGVYAFGETTASITVKDTFLNTYTKVLTAWQADNFGSDFLNLYYAVSSSGGANTVTAQGPSSSGFWGVAAAEFSGVGTPTLGVNGGANTAGSNPYSGVTFTPSAGDLLIAFYGDEAGAETITTGNGWTQAATSATGNNNNALSYFLSAAGTATHCVWNGGGGGAGNVYMALAPSGGSTPVSTSDTGSGTDTVSIRVSVSETGGGTDAPTLGAALPLTDSGTATDTVVLVLALADSGAGTDAVTLAAATPLSDTGTGTDTPSLVAALPVADSGAGADSVLLKLSTTDSGAGTDTLALAASLPTTDTGAGGDGATLGVTTADAGIGSDAATPVAALTTTDTGTGTDSATLATPIATSDSGSGTDSPTLTAAIPVSDTGTGADSANQTAALPVADSGSGTDAVSLGTPVLTTESGAAGDTLATAAAVPITESGLGVDAGALGLTLAESGSGFEGTALGVAVAVSESAAALETLLIAAAILLADTGVGADAVHVSISGGGGGVPALIRAAFAVIARAVSFGAEERLVRFSAARRTTNYKLYMGIGGLMYPQPITGVNPPYIGDAEANIPFSLDFANTLFGGEAIVSAAATCMTAAPGATPSDVSATVVRQVTFAQSVVTVLLGNGSQTQGNKYYLNITVTTNASPARTIQQELPPILCPFRQN